MDTINLAKTYSHHGLQCFPLKAKDKIPFVQWKDVATSEENMLVGWFENDPNANIGIACGKRSGIVVLDVDAAHGGYESIQNLIEIYGNLPTTPIAKTGGGGEHIFFKYPGVEIRNSTSKLGQGLDVRGDGGYVVAAPSIHPNGSAYEWIIGLDIPLADMPGWIIELLSVKEAPVPVVTNGLIANGSRNDTLTRKAGAMRRANFNEDEIYQALILYNRRNCLPPLSDGEVLQIAKSIQRYEPKAELQTKEPQLVDQHSVIDELESEIKVRELDPKEVWGINYAWPALSQITGGKQPGDLTYVAGEPGVGKSWWAHQDMMMGAIGNPQLGIEPVSSLVWCREMPRKQTVRRMFEMLGVPKDAMKTGFNMAFYWQTFNEAKAILTNSPLYVCDDPIDLDGARLLIEREIKVHGIKQALFDYDWHVSAPGSNEIETSQNISRAFKQMALDYGIAITMISSVNKAGMDVAVSGKSNLSGSGKKLHDADIIYILSKTTDVPMEFAHDYKPADFWKLVTLNIEKGRDFEYGVGGGKLLYARETPNPRFKELTKCKPSRRSAVVEA